MNNSNHTCYTLSRNSDRCDVCGARLPRLIDADALKKDIAENSITLEGVWAIEVECAKALIDNTPTVDDLTFAIAGRTNGKTQAVLDAVRPKGEWIEYDEDGEGCEVFKENDNERTD